ncbi:coiled-coil domain-containing protein 13 isoform X1 [Varanus komodoensis]|uniref:Coiled-coil domain-containing protein 13 n=1 Tax=Varanus komodoensis TaxID=61221 RepID=A0A8D2LHS7_VARKO|nr:coiled-coil domain-containing protein 13 isoform X1 [Varanus komodoensis]
MEIDEQLNENLKMQFRALQEQQQKRMLDLMEKKKAKQQSLQTSKDGQNEAFGVQDDLNLTALEMEISKEDSPEMSKEAISKRLLEDENEQLQNQLRETVDENGRLYKLLKERDFEIKQLQKKIEEERLALMGTPGLAGDAAATKIVELAKQHRHMTAEIERGKTKVKQLNNRIKELEKELQISTIKLQSFGDKNIQPAYKTAEVPLSPEIKALQDKLTATSLKLSECRNQLQTTKQELKMTQKLLASEAGEDVSVQSLLSSPGSWRGRAQQILVLQGRVRELENQLGHSKSRTSQGSGDEEALSFTDSRKKSAQEKNLQRIRSLEKEKKEALEKLTGEYSALQKEHEEVKRKLEGSKARSKVLSSEVKTLKEQISTLLDKGKHDDELIDALLSQQKEMQVILKNLSQQEERSKEHRQSLGKELQVEAQKQNCLIGQLKQMVAEREAKVKELEETVRQLASQQHLHQTEERNSDSTSTLSAESLEEENYTAVPRKDGLTGTDSSARTVSKMGHTLVASAATSSPGTVSHGRTDKPDDRDTELLLIQITECKTLCQAAEAERDGLRELVNTLQKRLDDSTIKVWEAEKKFQEQQHRCAVLEQHFEKMKSDAGKNSGTQRSRSKGGAAQPHGSTRLSWTAGNRKDLSPAQLSEVPLEAQVEELSTRLEIQMEENEGLKNALQEAMKSKEEDFRAYQETVDQVKQIFLKALRQQKQDKN